MDNRKETLFITGGSGFIGKNIAQFFNEKYEILAPSHRELDLLSQDEVDRYFEMNKIDYVIHCANSGGSRKATNVSNVLENNLRMFHILSNHHDHYKKMISFGSGAEYAKDRMKPMVKEDDFGKYIPADDYGFSKYIISKYIENSENIYCLRLFGVFGPYEDYEFRFISNAIVKNLFNLPINIVQNVYFDWLYIEDLMKILGYFLTNEMNEKVYNVTTGKTYDLVTIANIINSCSPCKSEIIIQNGGLNKEYSGDNSRMINEIGSFEFTSMSDAIKSLFDYYRSIRPSINCEVIKKDPFASMCKVYDSDRKVLNITTDK